MDEKATEVDKLKAIQLWGICRYRKVQYLCKNSQTILHENLKNDDTKRDLQDKNKNNNILMNKTNMKVQERRLLKMKNHLLWGRSKY
jgi:hypothetical protein